MNRQSGRRRTEQSASSCLRHVSWMLQQWQYHIQSLTNGSAADNGHLALLLLWRHCFRALSLHATGSGGCEVYRGRFSDR